MSNVTPVTKGSLYYQMPRQAKNQVGVLVTFILMTNKKTEEELE